jgi:phenylacetate-coenzyme A ligase PaaK-like adenylate-forming protein
MLTDLTAIHQRAYDGCAMYRRICDTQDWSTDRLETFPIVPTQYFKYLGRELCLPGWEREFKSAATTGQPSVVRVSRETLRSQQRALVAELKPILGGRRWPIVWSNTPDDHVAVRGFVASGFLDPIHPGCVDDPVVMVGFTHTVWNDELVPDDGTGVPQGSVLFHIGGWKHLANQAVSKARFNEEAHKRGFTRVVDCYGFTEQLGTVHMDCEHGRKHVAACAALFVRHPITHDVVPDGETGYGHFLSTVPKCYPGFSVLVDDLVRVTGRGCECGRAGTTFEVLGRAKGTELRGCGDVLAAA